MVDLEYIIHKLNEYSDKSVEMTPKRVRSLANYLKDIKEMVEINTRSNHDSDIIFKREDLEDVGRMDYLLKTFYPNTDVPKELRKYQNFVNRIKGIDNYHDVLEAKLQRDNLMLRKKDSVSEADDMIYARSVVGIIESDELIPERSKLLVLYEGEQLYEENIPEYVFKGLPDKSTLIFNYTSQGLNFDLKETMEECKSGKVDLSKAEKIIIESLARDSQSMSYIDSIYEEINKRLE